MKSARAANAPRLQCQDEHDDDITSSTSKSSELPDGSDALSMWKLKLIKDKHMMQSTMNEFKFYLVCHAMIIFASSNARMVCNS